MEKRINGHEQYGITDSGEVISYKYKAPRKMSLWENQGGYIYANLCEDNVMKHYAVHQLVAEAFIPNPNKYTEVHHINGNTRDNRVENLEWCSRSYNVRQTYSKKSPARNKIKCQLIQISTNSIVKIFDNKKAAAEYAADNFNCSKSSMIKYGHCKDYKLERCND